MPDVLAIPGTLCAPRVFDRLADRLAGEAAVAGVSWLTEPGPWDVQTVAERIVQKYPEPGLVLGHSTNWWTAFRTRGSASCKPATRRSTKPRARSRPRSALSSAGCDQTRRAFQTSSTGHLRDHSAGA